MTKEFFDRGKWIAKWADNQPVWQGLSDDEVQKILSKISDDMYPWKEGMLGHLIARAIEQALKEKNT